MRLRVGGGLYVNDSMPRSARRRAGFAHAARIIVDPGDSFCSPRSSGMTAPASADDKLDAGVLKIAGVVVLGAIMSILDVTVVSVALPTFQSRVRGHLRHRRVDDDGLHAGSGRGDSGHRMGRGPVRYQAPVSALAHPVRRRIGALRHRVEHRRADHLPGRPGPRRRHADAAGHDDHDPRRRPAPGRAGDGSARHPDAAGPDLRPDPRRLADRERLLALDLPDQPADRHRRADLRDRRAAQGQPGAVADLRLAGHAAAVARSGAVPLRRGQHPR